MISASTLTTHLKAVIEDLQELQRALKAAGMENPMFETGFSSLQADASKIAATLYVNAGTLTRLAEALTESSEGG